MPISGGSKRAGVHPRAQGSGNSRAKLQSEHWTRSTLPWIDAVDDASWRTVTRSLPQLGQGRYFSSSLI